MRDRDHHHLIHRAKHPGVADPTASSAYGALNCLWRLSQCPDERTPHPLAISEAVLPDNLFGGEAAGLHHQPCRFHAQAFDCLCG